MKRIVLILIKARLFWNTVHHLKFKQITYRVYYRVREPGLIKVIEPVLRGVLLHWPGAAFMQPATEDGNTFTFLGETAQMDGNWNHPKFSKLWLYNLHYMDDLNALGADSKREFGRSLIESWIDANPPLQGNGWEPYCLSLRIVNWVKWLSLEQADKVDPKFLQSLATQAKVLEQRLEFHILANHLFANAKALIFVGSYLGGRDGDRWLKKGLKVFDQEIDEQFLDDGAHFELSPMYHAILLWDLADLLALQQISGLEALSSRAEKIRGRILKGLEWLRAMVHTDGDIAFFNDATLGIAPTLTQLEGYAGQLNCLPELSAKSFEQSIKLYHLKDSGYLVVDWPNKHRAILNAAQVGPDYQPGHAHADTLSFELSLFAQRVVVNSGISQYGEDAERHAQRSTAAHNTVEVDGENSSEIWAGFRVARRARVFDLDVLQEPEKVKVSAAHDGYKRLPGKVIHRRWWVATSSELAIEDRLVGPFKKAKAYFHFHPDVELEQVDVNHWKGRLPEGQVFDLSFEGGVVKQKEGNWHPKFGVSLLNTCLVVYFQAQELTTRISWSHS